MADTAAMFEQRVARGEDESIEALIKAADKEVYEYRGKRYRVHPASMAFPLAEGEEFEALVQSIRERGVRNPVFVTGDQIVDGRNRMRAAKEVGPDVEITFRELGPDEDPCTVAREQNLHRRDLDSAQKIALASQIRRLSIRLEALELERAAQKAAERERAVQQAGGAPGEPASDAQPVASVAPAGAGADGAVAPEAGSAAPAAEPVRDLRGRRDRDITPGLTQKEAAAQVGVSERSVRRFETVVKDAPELESEIEQGNISVKDALAVRQEDPELRKQAVDDVKAGSAKTAAQAVEKRTGRAPKAAPRKRAAPPRKDADGAGETAAGMPPLPSVGGAAGAAAVPGGIKVGPPQRTVALPPTATSSLLLLAGVRLSLGMIDLDPCSSAQAQLQVGAAQWFGSDKDGMKQAWSGSCYVFPPPVYVSSWAGKLLNEMTSGRVTRAAFFGPAGLDERWAQRFLEHKAFTGLVVEVERPQYEVEGGDPVQTARGMALFLFGVEREKLFEAFGSWGVVLHAVNE